MTIGKNVKDVLAKGDFKLAKKLIKLSPGDAVRVAREMLEWSQNELAERSGIPQSTISGIEKNRINLGVDRAKTLARALGVHPAVLLFSDWNAEKEGAA